MSNGAPQQNTGRVQNRNLTNAGKGRPKGVPNKTTATLKSMILEALDNAGGVKYLTKQADENPVAFMTLVGKIIPLQSADDAPKTLTIEWKS